MMLTNDGGDGRHSMKHHMMVTCVDDHYRSSGTAEAASMCKQQEPARGAEVERAVSRELAPPPRGSEAWSYSRSRKRLGIYRGLASRSELRNPSA